MGAMGFAGNMEREKKSVGCRLYEGAAQRYGAE